MGSQKEKREKKNPRKYLETISENFPNKGKEIVNQVQGVQRAPGRINPRRNTPRHTVIKLIKIKDKDKILKETREKQQITYSKTPIRLSANFSTEILQARMEWHDIFKVLKGKN